MKYTIDQTITTKKPHVCGNNQWLIIRTGADIKMKCLKCSREVMIPKYELDKKIKQDS